VKLAHRILKTAYLTLGLALLGSLRATAEDAPTALCVVDREVLQLPRCALETRRGQLYVARRFLPSLFTAQRSLLAAVFLPDEGWAYVDRRGLLVVRHVATMDNGPSEFHHGLVRVTEAGKWGLADTRGRLVVPLRYDGMLDYDDEGGWRACTGCGTASDGEHAWFTGGEWISLDRKGKTVHPRAARLSN